MHYGRKDPPTPDYHELSGIIANYRKHKMTGDFRVLARIGVEFHGLTWVGVYWLVLACIGLYWPVLAFIGIYWHLLACIGIYWPVLAEIRLGFQPPANDCIDKSEMGRKRQNGKCRDNQVIST
jgi:hypothetical protein